MRAVNLLPREIPTKSFEANRGVAFGATGGFALISVALAALMLSAGGAVEEQRSRLDVLNAELAALPRAEAAQPSNDAELAGAKSERIRALSGAMAGRTAWDRVLRELSQILPEDVWLASLASQEPAAAAADPTAAGSGILLTGSTYSQSGVARLLARLAVMRTVTNVTLQSSTAEAVRGQRIVRFTIVADVKPGGGS
jgi:Tfp pilus assembly protein PilN